MILKNRILIRYNIEQKQEIDGFSIVPNRHTYEQNGIETNPVVAVVEEVGSGVPLSKGDTIVLHHNTIFDNSYKIEGYRDMSVIRYDRWILAKINSDGQLIASEFNIIAENIKMDFVSDWAIPDTAKTNRWDAVQVISGMNANLAYILKWANYGVCYIWEGVIKRSAVVFKDHIIAITKKNNDMEVLEAIKDKVIVKPESEVQSIGGFDIAQTAQVKPRRGTVIAAGAGGYAPQTGVLIPNEVSVGDTVLYSKNAGTPIEFNNEEYLVLSEAEVLSVIKIKNENQ